MYARFKKHRLIFTRPSGTSRGILKTKDSWFIELTQDENIGIGECSIISGLSIDDISLMEQNLNQFCENPGAYAKTYQDEFAAFPAIRMAIETAIQDLSNRKRGELFETDFITANKGIWINGLIWMGQKSNMLNQINQKLSQGYRCLKLKIGAIDFNDEIDLLKNIRSQFPSSDLELRVDANGAFDPEHALEKLKRLAELSIHSIEQPIKANQYEKMAKLCQESPIDIALDEELIGVNSQIGKMKLLNDIRPQFIILKPSLLGGFKAAQEWIDIAEQLNIDWWVTSALESNIGLNAIAQWTSTLNISMPQGLGTGQLFKNNIASPLYIKGQYLHYDQKISWGKIFE